jgi:hypothetical protein
VFGFTTKLVSGDEAEDEEEEEADEDEAEDDEEADCDAKSLFNSFEASDSMLLHDWSIDTLASYLFV